MMMMTMMVDAKETARIMTKTTMLLPLIDDNEPS
jgi:hypothetical protein